MQIAPPAPTWTIAAFGTIAPAVKFSVDASGNGPPQGKTVRKPSCKGLIAVTLTATARAFCGTVPRPATVTVVIDPPARRPTPANWPSTVGNSAPARVSIRRAGCTPEKLEPNG